MHTTHGKGDVGLLKIMSDVTERGFSVSLPISGVTPYDMIVDANNILYRIQVKYRSVISGEYIEVGVRKNTYTRERKHHKIPINRADIDVVGVFCPELDICMYFSVEELGEGSTLRFRLPGKVPKNGQVKGIRYTSDYMIFPPNR